MAGQSSEMLRTSSVIKVPDIANCAPTLANKCKRLKQNTRVINSSAWYCQNCFGRRGGGVR
jgi:hypothetical protein